MSGLTWLHLSDWHQKGADFDRRVVRDALLDDLRQQEMIDASLSQVDFVVLSGDVACQGKAEEYKAARECNSSCRTKLPRYLTYQAANCTQ
jgi:hypothetical protein